MFSSTFFTILLILIFLHNNTFGQDNKANNMLLPNFYLNNLHPRCSFDCCFQTTHRINSLDKDCSDNLSKYTKAGLYFGEQHNNFWSNSKRQNRRFLTRPKQKIIDFEVLMILFLVSLFRMKRKAHKHRLFTFLCFTIIKLIMFKINSYHKSLYED